jgi:hypothetical protein
MAAVGYVVCGSGFTHYRAIECSWTECTKKDLENLTALIVNGYSGFLPYCIVSAYVYAREFSWMWGRKVSSDTIVW